LKRFWFRNWHYILAFVIAGSIIAAQVYAGRDADVRAIAALEGAGYTEVKLSGQRWWGCGSAEYMNYGFIAKGPTGKTVMGVACSGMSKYTTIRLH